MTPEALGNTPPETEPEKKSYGQIVREMRYSLGFSQAYLAVKAGVSPGYVSQIENDQVENPSFAVHTRIAGALGFSIDDTEAKEASIAIFLEPPAAYIQKNHIGVAT